MIKLLKSNKLLIFLLLTICIIFIISPAVYSQSCLDSISLWAFRVMPSLLPFFMITRLIINLVSMKPNKVDKLMNKVYHTPNMSAVIFFLSMISGYPMGAKLICTAYENGQMDKPQAERLLSICSISGPMFMVGTVGVGFLLSMRAGVIIMVSNIIACLINGFIYRGKKVELTEVEYHSKHNTNILHDAVYDALISILIVGGFMVLSGLIIDVLKNLGFLDNLSNAICSVLRLNNSQDIVYSILTGTIEITSGIASLSASNCSLILMAIISSTLIAFGGISIFMQSLAFTSKIKISTKTMLKQKLTQAIICLVITTLLCFLFL